MTAKRHHYVPQSYLRRFVAAGAKSDQLWAYDKTDGKIFKSNVINLAQEVGFYWFEAQGIKISAEEGFAELEGDAKTAMDLLIVNGTSEALPEQARAHISLFMALQELRTPLMRVLPEEFRQVILNKWPEMQEAATPLAKDDLSLLHLRSIVEMLPEVATIISHYKWIMCHNATELPLWTSDNPLFRHNDLEEGFFSNLGLFSPGIQLICPLTPEWLLLMCDPVLFAALPARSELTKDNVLFYNTGQIAHSRRYVFGASKDFAVADKYLAEYPLYRDPNRLRTQGE